MTLTPKEIEDLKKNVPADVAAKILKMHEESESSSKPVIGSEAVADSKSSKGEVS